MRRNNNMNVCTYKHTHTLTHPPSISPSYSLFILFHTLYLSPTRSHMHPPTHTHAHSHTTLTPHTHPPYLLLSLALPPSYPSFLSNTNTHTNALTHRYTYLIALSLFLLSIAIPPNADSKQLK